jgi:NADPH:quinone reductase-like Zn-dependent oxidoreductase
MRDTKILVTGAAGATGWTAIKMRMELKAFVRAVVHGKDTRSEQRSVQGEHARKVYSRYGPEELNQYIMLLKSSLGC